MIREPLPAEAPVIDPVLVPMVHAKVLGAEAVRLILGPVALQIAAAAALVIAGLGLTVTVILNGAPTQEPAVAVGVTAYTIEPVVALLGLASV